MRIISKLLLALGITSSGGANAAEPKIVADVRTSAEWIAKALASSGYKADFSLESLREVDRFFEEQAPSGIPKPGGLLSEGLGSRLFAIGSYTGEVIRRKAGGEWSGNDADPEAEINVELRLPDGTRMWPIQRVMKRFKGGIEEGVYAYGVASTSR